MSAILDLAENINIDASPNIRISSSLNGYVRTEQGGPVFYTISATLPYMKRDEYKIIQQEIIELNYGINTINTTIPFGVTYFEGAWNSSAAFVSNNGDDVFIGGFDANQSNTVLPTDYLQFAGDTKVYQAKNGPDADADGNITLNLNTNLIKTPLADATITRGEDVVFKLLLAGIPPVATITIANNDLLYKFTGSFDFVEVL